ncbi:HdeA/HdeB family chaperone [Rubellimicrobium arenae]|uniref:HdeA/HdeB family chaperone n=1 Tax=Rubellimicrobium arenae TaxID=2817372 RepID=UPI001B30300F|nr:HdeA/HdeB family chaperone [Rubellimicrobium arenae]
MRSLAYLGLALAASLTTALPALAQDETSGTEQTTEPTDPAAEQDASQGATEQGTDEAAGQDAGQATTEPSTDAGTGQAADQTDAEQGTDQAAADSTAQAGPSGEIRPVTITCQDIVDTDVQLVPQLVYWIDGYNIAYDAATGQTDVDPVVSVAENWLAVPVENIIRACEANPDSAAADVIAQERANNEGAAAQ